jgi:hypothetical protein
MAKHHRTSRTPDPSASPAVAAIVPPVLVTLMGPFRSLFTAPVWDHVLVLVAGAILTPGKHTVSAVLHIMGLSQATDFALYHHVLSRGENFIQNHRFEIPDNVVSASGPDPIKGAAVLGPMSSRCGGLLPRTSHRTGYADHAYGSWDRYVRTAAAAALTPVLWCSARSIGSPAIPAAR